MIHVPRIPNISPYVENDGNYDIDTSFNVTEAVLRTLIGQMADNKVSIEHTILKASMVISFLLAVAVIISINPHLLLGLHSNKSHILSIIVSR